ncbi:hypothetical protein [Chondromyces apiculatus]|uniref:HEAT repeat domain-containing protein n=1 Tax=Chondromyces apiculatus DSM 436 TaxID=1192034 RepID=A0A017TCW5_9BACT|nr:hypothetical protein [Chondromyces apiculatus]EYF06655.1 Hypothetical protein CAP_1785 [Chondromyces apiculatus DSM 436]
MAGAAFVSGGCRVDETDIHRWEKTVYGPEKLKAVLIHDKYETPLQVEAALSLIRMEPRQGRHVGLGILLEGLSAIPAEARQPIWATLIPAIIAELRRPPPVPSPAGQPAPEDPSYPYKDAAFMVLSAEPPILDDEVQKQNLKTALIEWVLADFERRLDNRQQAYGMEQLLRLIGAPAVAGLPKLLNREARRLDQTASLIAELGDPATKAAASEQLASVARWTLSSEWLQQKKPELQKANEASKLAPTEKQLEAQLAQYQDEELFRLFGSMRKIGGRPVVEFLLGVASDPAQGEKRRQAALAALEKQLSKDNPEDLRRVLGIVTKDAPDAVLDQAFRRIGELPREQIAESLYGLFKMDKWKTRRAAAATLLRLSTVKHIDEFLGKLPEPKGFALPEAITYGALLGDLKEGVPVDALRPHLTKGSPTARASAVAYYFTFGKPADLEVLKPLESDGTRAPTCDADPDCKWTCEVAKSGSAEREQREITTIGEFVRYCIEPAVEERSTPPENRAGAPLEKADKTEEKPTEKR